MNYEFTYKDKEYSLKMKEKTFGMDYVRNGFNGTKAAITAGYSAKTATVTGSKLLREPNIKAYVEMLKENLAMQLEISAFDIANEFKKIAFGDVRKLYDEHGNLIEIHKLDDATAAAISEVEVEENRIMQTKTTKVKRYSKPESLTKLARMIGVEGVLKTSATDSKGNDVPVTPNVVILKAEDLTDEQLERITGRS